jgi:hypothetical protein
VTNPLLQPMPMSADEVIDLIRRTRAQGANAKAWPKAQLAAAFRFAIRERKPLSAAARKFRIHRDALRRYWLKRRPGVPILVSKRGGL